MKPEIQRVVHLIGRGFYMEDLEILQKAIEKKGKLPKKYFETEENCCCETWGTQWRRKSELREIKASLVREITNVINSQKMEADNYCRYFHALAILKADRDQFKPKEGNFVYNGCLALWKLDDGSQEKWEIIDDASWFFSEAMKNL